jgi:3-isopropylmalate dehydrogenase
VTTINLGVIAGDGIGPEVTHEAVETLRLAYQGKAEIDTTSYPLGAGHYLETGEILGDDTLESLAHHDALLLGAVGGDPNDARLAGGLIERGLLLRLRFAFDHYVNLRPTRLVPGLVSPLAEPGDVDFVVVREGTEGPYTGNGGAVRVGTANEVATEVSLNTRFGVERLVRHAFGVAMSRQKKLTLVHKTNVLGFAGSLWSRTVSDVAREFPDVTVDYLHVDATMIFLVTNPSRFDVIVTDNLFGDIVTDLAAAIGGGIGQAASANINPEGTFPSMFEPVHGSAPDIAGKNIADPTAAILSAALLARHLGHDDVASAIERACWDDLAKRSGPTATTEVGARIRDRLS